MLADHGNADYMINDDGSPNTAHSLALVPCFVLAPDAVLGLSVTHTTSPEHLQKSSLRNGTLADIAPTILHIMGIEQPPAMSGRSLLVV